jgi:hypothetical protein
LPEWGKGWGENVNGRGGEICIALKCFLTLLPFNEFIICEPKGNAQGFRAEKYRGVLASFEAAFW